MLIYKSHFWVGSRRMFFDSTGAVLRSRDSISGDTKPRQYASGKLMEVLEKLSASKRSKRTMDSANRKFRAMLKQGMFGIQAYPDRLRMGCQYFSWTTIKKLMAMRRRAM